MTNTGKVSYNHPNRPPVGTGSPIVLHPGIAVILIGPRAGRTVINYVKRGR